MGGSTADPGQDSRGAPDLMPLWRILDFTPEGRRSDWYPSLSYDRRDSSQFRFNSPTEMKAKS